MAEPHWPIERVLDQLWGLPWHHERRAGTEHLRSGQHRAAPAAGDEETPIVVVLLYVAADGHGRCAIIGDRAEDGAWDIVPVMTRWDALGVRQMPLPMTWTLTDLMNEAMDAAAELEPGGYYLAASGGQQARTHGGRDA